MRFALGFVERVQVDRLVGYLCGTGVDVESPQQGVAIDNAETEWLGAYRLQRTQIGIQLRKFV